MKQPIHPVEKEKRGIVGTHAASVAAKFTAEEKLAFSIEAMRNGGECEACQ
jgi:ribonucleoside-diphosphate reductase alpha chain